MKSLWAVHIPGLRRRKPKRSVLTPVEREFVEMTKGMLAELQRENLRLLAGDLESLRGRGNGNGGGTQHA